MCTAADKFWPTTCSHAAHKRTQVIRNEGSERSLAATVTSPLQFFACVLCRSSAERHVRTTMEPIYIKETLINISSMAMFTSPVICILWPQHWKYVAAAR